jgi:hypothetical protein
MSGVRRVRNPEFAQDQEGFSLHLHPLPSGDRGAKELLNPPDTYTSAYYLCDLKQVTEPLCASFSCLKSNIITIAVPLVDYIVSLK